MSHHGKMTPGELPEAIRQILNQPLIGATGEHPEGKLNSDDEGGLQFRVGDADGKICIDFGQPVVWIGMNPEDAMGLAQLLIKRARKVAKDKGLSLRIKA